MIECVVEDGRWRGVGVEALAERAAAATLGRLGLEAGGFEIALLACDDARIAGLNADFRGRAMPTNVLSWPAAEPPPRAPGTPPSPPVPGSADDPAFLGDLALGFETCEREAADAGLGLAHHVLHLVVHGVLHLCGFDHERDEDAALMESLEAEILGQMGVADPYSRAE